MENFLIKTNPAKYGIFYLQIFQHSIIPCLRQNQYASINIYNFNKLKKFQDVELTALKLKA